MVFIYKISKDDSYAVWVQSASQFQIRLCLYSFLYMVNECIWNADSHLFSQFEKIFSQRCFTFSLMASGLAVPEKKSVKGFITYDHGNHIGYPSQNFSQWSKCNLVIAGKAGSKTFECTKPFSRYKSMGLFGCRGKQPETRKANQYQFYKSGCSLPLKYFTKIGSDRLQRFQRISHFKSQLSNHCSNMCQTACIIPMQCLAWFLYGFGPGFIRGLILKVIRI